MNFGVYIVLIKRIIGFSDMTVPGEFSRPGTCINSYFPAVVPFAVSKSVAFDAAAVSEAAG